MLRQVSLLIFALSVTACTYFATIEDARTARREGRCIDAEKIYTRLAEAQSLEAQNELAFMYEMGQCVQKNQEAALRLYSAAAERGDSDAQWALGMMYGEIDRFDRSRMVKWLERSADQSDWSRMIDLANFYRKKGMMDLARPWFERVAKMGIYKGQTEMGTLYLEGQGVPQNYVEARKWFLLAAKQDDDDAHFHLGWMYFEGKGGDVDLVNSHMHFNIYNSMRSAPLQNNIFNPVYKVEQLMTKEQISRAQAMAIEWKKGK